MRRADGPQVSYLLQTLLVVALAGVMTVLTDELNFRSGWNVIWMAVLPGAIGWLANGDAGRRAFMAMSLVVLALVTVAAVGVTLGGI